MLLPPNRPPASCTHTSWLWVWLLSYQAVTMITCSETMQTQQISSNLLKETICKNHGCISIRCSSDCMKEFPSCTTSPFSSGEEAAPSFSENKMSVVLYIFCMSSDIPSPILRLHSPAYKDWDVEPGNKANQSIQLLIKVKNYSDWRKCLITYCTMVIKILGPIVLVYE